MTFLRLLALLAVFAAAGPALAAEPDKDGFVPLFNGKDLTGWVPVNVHPKTFFVKDGEIVTTGQPIGFLRTEKQYENFILEIEWMHVNKKEIANSGIFVWGDPLPVTGSPFTRGIEVQVLINYPKVDWATNHGDVFAIQGATCKPDRPHPKGAMRCLPSEERVKGGGEWNHYKIIANNGTIKLHVNGKEVSGVSECNPRKGYLALESEGAECHFRNIRIKELPSSNPEPKLVAKETQGHRSLFTGLDLSGWKTEEGAWKAAGGHLRSAGKTPISTEQSFGPCELIFDWKLPAKAEQKLVVEVGGAPFTASAPAGAKPGTWQRQTIQVERPRQPGSITFHPVEGLELTNIFVRELK